MLDTDGLRRLLGKAKSLPEIDVSLEVYEDNGVLVEVGDGSNGEGSRPSLSLEHARLRLRRLGGAARFDVFLRQLFGEGVLVT